MGVVVCARMRVCACARVRLGSSWGLGFEAPVGTLKEGPKITAKRPNEEPHGIVNESKRHRCHAGVSGVTELKHHPVPQFT